MRSVINIPAIERLQGCKDAFLVCDLPGLVETAKAFTGSRPHRSSWTGGKSFDDALHCAGHGDLTGVEASDAFLAEVESMVFVSKKFRTIDDVCGGVPNIPNYIAGLPMAMRRRVRQAAPIAPLAIIADLTSSAVINAKDVNRRGAAILALVRMLSNVRPIELWTLTAKGDEGQADYVLCRMETAPLDLARVAFALTHVSFARALCYGLADGLLDGRGAWPYGISPKPMRDNAHEILLRVISPGSDVLYVPPVHKDDKAVNNPTEWLRDMLAAHGGETVQQDD